MKKLFVVLSLVSAAWIVPSALAAGLAVGDTVPCFKMKHIERDGTNAERCMTEREGASRFMILEFFTTTCSACQANLPIIAKLGKDVAATTTTRFVALDRSEANIATYVSSHRVDLDYTVAMDLTREASRAFAIAYVPTVVVIGPGDKILYSHVGVLSAAEQESIRQLVK